MSRKTNKLQAPILDNLIKSRHNSLPLPKGPKARSSVQQADRLLVEYNGKCIAGIAGIVDKYDFDIK